MPNSSDGSGRGVRHDEVVQRRRHLVYDDRTKSGEAFGELFAGAVVQFPDQQKGLPGDAGEGFDQVDGGRGA